ncbi:glycosyltransferase family 2 protein [bacterium]|nr:glycosyltransferase family 2 protein [bacterium]
MVMIPVPHARSLSVVIPYYNEEANIEPSLHGALDYLRRRFDDFEIVAVDDKSTDATLSIARRIAAGEPRVRVVALDTNTRFAGALKAGFAAATKEYVFYTDGDCPICWDDLDRAIVELIRYDAVVGYRTTRDKEGWIRKLYTTAYRLTLRAALGLSFRDVNFSFKLFSRNALAAVMPIASTGSFIDAEILCRLLDRGLAIREIPVQYRSRVRGTSTLATPAVIVKLLGELASFWNARRKTRGLRGVRRPRHELPDLVDQG